MKRPKSKKPVKSVKTPKNLEQCFEALNILLFPEDVQEIKNGTEKDMCKYHFFLGMWIRNNWGLWKKNSKLYDYFKGMGLWHADDMSSVILDSYYRNLNNLPLGLDKQIEAYKKYWKEYPHTEEKF